jgi:hypothetical protein
MTAETSFGFESIARGWCRAPVVVAFIRVAKKRSSSGAIARSCFATMYHDGLVFHATCDTLAANADAAIGFCVAARTAASAAGRSQANCFATAVRGQAHEALCVDESARRSSAAADRFLPSVADGLVGVGRETAAT